MVDIFAIPHFHNQFFFRNIIYFLKVKINENTLQEISQNDQVRQNNYSG